MAALHYITGLPRSGSSMMMKALINGGMTGVYDNTLDFLNERDPNYKPNPGGFYNLMNLDYSHVGRLHETHQGKVLKLPWRLAFEMPQAEYKAIILDRNPTEIKASSQKFLRGRWLEIPPLGLYDEFMDALEQRLLDREDTNVVRLNYADIVENPIVELQKLLDAGWSFNLNAAVDIIDPSLYRNRL